jgi:hypothetical protein
MTRTPATSGPDRAPAPVFAAVINAGETVLGTRSFPTTRTGYRAMLAWIGEFGDLARIGVEGTDIAPRIPVTGEVHNQFFRSEPARGHKSDTPEICKHPSHPKLQKLSYP